MELPENNKVFRSIGLAKESSFLINMDSQTFRECFNENVSDDVNFFGLSGHNKNFHGRISNTSFKIYRPASLIKRRNQAETAGAYEEQNLMTKITMVTYVSINFILLFVGGLLLFACIVNYLSITTDNVTLFTFFIFNGVFLIFGFRIYWGLRSYVKDLSIDVEREIGFWLAKMNDLQQRL